MEDNILIFIIVGFIAQMIDGALGMGYGVSSTSFLLGIGIPPAAASASVHAAEIFASGVSGFSHWKLGNVNKRLLMKLLIPGIIGGVIGAYLLTSIPGKTIKPFIAFYLLIMGLIIVLKAFRKIQSKEVKTYLGPLGFVGGFFDAIGGGGWGPIVTTTLVARGNNPRFTIGTINLVEFFVTIAVSIAFILTIGLVHWKIILGLTLGGVTAAPLAAFACRKVPTKALMMLVGVFVIFLSLRTLYLAQI